MSRYVRTIETLTTEMMGMVSTAQRNGMHSADAVVAGARPFLLRLLELEKDAEDIKEKLALLIQSAIAAAVREHNKACARLSENIPNHCSHEINCHGAGAIGAIVRYRDAIRALLPANQPHEDSRP